MAKRVVCGESRKNLSGVVREVATLGHRGVYTQVTAPYLWPLQNFSPDLILITSHSKSQQRKRVSEGNNVF